MKQFYMLIACWSILFSTQNVFAQATVTEAPVKFKTYPYSDPNPVAEITKHYPYYRFDGFAATPTEQEWKIVTLENKYVKVFVAPQMGGKVLGAIEKSTGEEFIYFNKVVKFRDISMRGAWTSGGIEFNFGSIGHAPTTASPVNYLLRNNSDGSASCIVGAPDITSGTEWRVEICLPANASYFETKAIWYNPTEQKTSLYNWMTASVDVSDDLEYFFPGHTEIGHGGEAGTWPVNKDGVKISMYKNNNFAGAKSYHVLGEYAEDFVCYFHNKEFGLGHWSPYDEKPGQKIWLWALSREGEIWADLLTDPGNVQYTEIQTGLLFNQEAENSTYSPYKHMFFNEGSDVKFTELWFPVKGIGGRVKAGEKGTLNIERTDNKAIIGFCANEEISEALVVTADGKEIIRKNISLKPTEFIKETIETGSAVNIEVKIGADLKYNTKEAKDRKLSKPVKINEGYNWNSVGGMLTEGTELEKQRLYGEARKKFIKVLETDEFNTEALTRMAGLYYRSMEYEKAKDFALKALANDTYYPEANYIFGLVSKKTGKKYDALDGFSMAARSVSYKSVANQQIAEILFSDGEMQKCLKYNDQALDYNRYNISALKLKTLVLEKTGRLQERESVLNEILNIDPLNAFARFEKNDDFEKSLQYEMPDQVCLELAIWYFNLGLSEKAVQVLKSVKETPIINYWLAFILNDTELINKAVTASTDLVFPFRTETADVLKWALNKNNNWQTKYYLGLIYWSKGRNAEATELFKACKTEPANYAFYLTRFELLKGEKSYNGEADLLKAQEMAPAEWRCFKALTEYYEEKQEYYKALQWAKNGYTLLPGNYILAYQCAKSQLISGQYKEALNILTNTTILPNEGASYGRTTYRQACILDAVNNLKNSNDKVALARIKMAREWPENLGVGKPYNTDERIEDYLERRYWLNKKDATKAKYLEEKVVTATLNANYPSSADYLGAVLMKESGREKEAKVFLQMQIEKAPKNLIARWNLAKFEGNTAEADELLKKIEVENGGSLLSPKVSDSGLALVLDITDKI